MLHIYLCRNGHDLLRKAEHIENLSEIRINKV